MEARLPAPVFISAQDAEWAFSEINQIPTYNSTPQKSRSINLLQSDEQIIAAAGLSCKAIATPGHSPGGVCFYFQKEGILFAGDTLFQNSVGRTDLPGGDPRILTQSLKKLALLPPETIVYPGHGPSTSIKEEKLNNFFFRFR